jgi:transglutaminase/protease-like cytokinesis protein 3
MKRCAGLILLFFTHFLAAQKPSANFGAIDWYVGSVHEASLDSLAFRLSAPYHTEVEKVRAIYAWICQNIQYNVDIYRPLYRRAKFKPEPVDTSAEWKSADEMVAQRVLYRRVAVCDGYARLFKVLCQYSGVEAVVLNGYGRTGFDSGKERFRSNHSWNAVRIDSAWYLVDATWAAGYINYADDFVSHRNDYYFLTAPEDFIRDHFPEDLRWTLLAQPPSIAEFKKMPFKSKAYLKYGIHAYTPQTGLIEAEPGDTLSFSIRLKDVKKAATVSPDPFLDTASFALSPLSVFIKPAAETADTVHYQFVMNDATQWIHLLFNDDVVLRYSINRKRSLVSK